MEKATPTPPHPHPEQPQFITVAGGRARSILKGRRRQTCWARLPAQVWIIGKTFLLIPSISTQMFNEENSFSLPPQLPHTAWAGPTGPRRPSSLPFPGPSHPEQGPGDSLSVTNQPVRPALRLGLLPGA